MAEQISLWQLPREEAPRERIFRIEKLKPSCVTLHSQMSFLKEWSANFVLDAFYACMVAVHWAYLIIEPFLSLCSCCEKTPPRFLAVGLLEKFSTKYKVPREAVLFLAVKVVVGKKSDLQPQCFVHMFLRVELIRCLLADVFLVSPALPSAKARASAPCIHD